MTAVVLGVVLAAAFLEGGLRIYSRYVPNADVEFVRYARLMKKSATGSATSFRHAPGVRARLMGVDVAIDARGFRDEPFPASDSTDVVRIGLLGDSVTFGWGVAYGDRFSERLERRWTSRLGRPVELVNTGHGNYNSAQEHAILEEVLSREDLRGILQVWYINDAEPTPPHRELPWWGRFHAAVFSWSKSDLLRRRLGARADYVQYYRDLYREDAEGFPAFREALDGVGAWARARGVPWVFVVLPEFHGFKPGGPFDEVYQIAAKTARDAGAIVVDATPTFRDVDPATIRVAYNDVHPNARGHAIIADAIDRAVNPAIFRAPSAVAEGEEGTAP